MAATTPSTILLSSVNTVNILERLAGEAVTPGKLVELSSTDTYQKQNTAGAPDVLVAIENSLIGGLISDDYASADTLLAASVQSGDVFYGFVPAGEASLAIGASLQSDNDGNVTATGSGTLIVRSLEAVDNSGGGTVARIKLQVI